MARDFDADTDQYLEYDGAIVTATPFTVAAWVKLDQLPSDYGDDFCIYHENDDSASNLFYLRVDNPTNTVQFNCRESDSLFPLAQSTASVVAGTWEHYCAVSYAVDSRSVFLNGGNKGTVTDTVAPIGLSKTFIGVQHRETPTDYLDGAIAEITVWDVALTDAEVLSLSSGYSSRFMRPGSIMARWDFFDSDKDPVGGHNLTPVNGPTFVDHPRIIYPSLVL